jgi:hypothetical protein
MMGEGYHLGSEVITKTANVEEAVRAAEDRMRERYSAQTILPEEQDLIERNILWTRNAILAWGEHYDRADFKVLYPEVSGCVPLPNTTHHCWFAHRILNPSVPYELCRDEKDRIPHYFAFRTDGVIEMYKHVWLLEQKTTSSTNQPTFWTKFQLDNQIRGYVYGVWRATGLLVDGVLVNAIIKHKLQKSENGIKRYILDVDNIGFERDHVLVGKQDALDFERELILLANEYEHKFSHPELLVKNPKSCFDWNRQCYYFDRCRRHNEDFEGEFRERDADYVEQHYKNILGLTTESEDEKCQTTAQTTAQIATNCTQERTGGPTARSVEQN